MGKTLVMKFGGTSVGSAAAIQRLVEITRQAQADWARVVVVVSAMNKVTDLLLAGAHAAAGGDAERPTQIAAELRQRHAATLAQLLAEDGAGRLLADEAGQMFAASAEEFDRLCQAVRVLGEASPRALDAISSLGERMSAPLVAAALSAAGTPAQAVDAARVVVTDGVYQAASPDMEATAARAASVLGPILAAGCVPVVTGFIGATPAGVVTTLGRGGSDFSAAILGVALSADEVWIWTDVDGVMTADPRLVPEARTLAELTFREISELAFYGAKVLHPKTIRPVVERGLGLWVKNTFNPSGPGTRVAADHEATHGGVKAVTVFKGQCVITLEGRGMIGIPGIAARTFAAVARTGTSVAMISQASSEQSICFVVPCLATGGVMRALQDEFRLELGRRDIDSVTTSPESAVVTVVGAGMRHTPGISGRVFGALGQSGVNVVAIAQGSSECSISLVVSAAEADDAVRAIHRLIVEQLDSKNDERRNNLKGTSSMPKTKVAILGATGAVGQRFVQLLEGHPWFEVTALTGSDRTVGQTYAAGCRWLLPTPMPEYARNMVVLPTEPGFEARLAFSALPTERAREAEPLLAAAGYAVCSNASAYRMAPDVPLIISAVNPDHTRLIERQKAGRGWSGFILTNPNCTSTGLTVALKALHDRYGLRKVFAVSLQALSGAGYPGVPSLDILDNVVPYIPGEEEKVESEPRKMLGRLGAGGIEPAAVSISAQCNRVAVSDGHLVCASVECEQAVSPAQVEACLAEYQAPAAVQGLPSLARPVLAVRPETDRPQPRLDRDTGRGMTTVVGRVRPDPLFHVKLIILSHNMVHGAAGGAILNGELLVAQGCLS